MYTLRIGGVYAHTQPYGILFGRPGTNYIQEVPLFMFTRGKPLSRNSCLKYLDHALKQIGYGTLTHNFRIGSAASASHAGISIIVIKVLGRW